MRWLRAVAILGVLSCSSGDGQSGADDDTSGRVTFAGSDAPGPGTEDAEVSEDADADLADVPPTPENSPPTFAALDPITLKMGQTTTLDLNEAIGDADDSDAQLELSWLSEHVAFEDPGDHRLQVVAPVDWFGTEQALLTVTDTGGLSASQNLVVVIEEVQAPDPSTDPDPTCGAVVFEHTAPGASEVLVSGSFNDWASDATGALAMTDTGGGAWQASAVLEPGTWKYKFVVDGEWIADPANPDTAPDGFDGVNSVLEVPPCE